MATFDSEGHKNRKANLLNADIPDQNPSPTPDEKTLKEELDYDTAAKQQALESKQNHERRQKDEHDQRLKYAKALFRLISIWLCIVLLIVTCSGLDLCFCSQFKLSDNVLITLLTTTTVTVLGLFITVLKYLFNHKNKTFYE